MSHKYLSMAYWNNCEIFTENLYYCLNCVFLEDLYKKMRCDRGWAQRLRVVAKLENNSTCTLFCVNFK